MGFQVLLFYKFVRLENPAAIADAQRELAKGLGLRGRILIASEGLNGTLSGTVEATERYMEATRNLPEFADLVFKIDPAEDHVFPRLAVKVRDEIVTLGEPLEHPEQTGPFLEPAEWREMLKHPDALILDIRNDYEYEIGHFEGAIRPDVQSFKEFPEWLDKTLEGRQDRPVLTYCTGGIRCEKLTAYLAGKGVPNVFQLHGGIIAYGKDPETRGAGWQGECFVFDDRVTVPINPEAKPVANCLHCAAPTSRYQNCAAVDCNRMYVCCAACEEVHAHSCSPECEIAPRRREPRTRLAPDLRSERVRIRRQAQRANLRGKRRAKVESKDAG